jgi:2-hydroxyglutarate dehydrogenase
MSYATVRKGSLFDFATEMLGRAIEFTVDHLVIGGGVIGLAVAARLSSQGRTLLVEKNPRFGEETSSRNSEVIHAGLYYPNNSLKMKTCLKGRRMLYDLCERYCLRYKKTGKWIVATTVDEISKLHQLKANADLNGVRLRFLSQDEIRHGEPHLKVDL